MHSLPPKIGQKLKHTYLNRRTPQYNIIISCRFNACSIIFVWQNFEGGCIRVIYKNMTTCICNNNEVSHFDVGRYRCSLKYSGQGSMHKTLDLTPASPKYLPICSAVLMNRWEKIDSCIASSSVPTTLEDSFPTCMQ